MVFEHQALIFTAMFHFIFSSFVRITVAGKIFEGKTDLIEEWYETQYSVSKIPPKYIEVRKFQLTDH